MKHEFGTIEAKVVKFESDSFGVELSEILGADRRHLQDLDFYDVESLYFDLQRQRGVKWMEINFDGNTTGVRYKWHEGRESKEDKEL